MQRILVADDEEDLELILRHQFQRRHKERNFQFEFVLNGAEAFNRLQQQEFDLVITDINMPQMDGLTLLKKIKEHFPYQKSLIVSAYNDMKNIRQAMHAGAYDFITKPINLEDLEITFFKVLEEIEVLKKGLEAKRNLDLALVENERIVREQNVILERKVEERTRELKDTQVQLVEIEKQKEVERVRSRISQDIHDDISSGLTKISWMSELVKVKATKNNLEEIHPALEKIIRVSRDTIGKLGEIIWATNPSHDNLESMLAYMRNYISDYLEGTPFAVNIAFDEAEVIIHMNPEFIRNLFLIMKEALHNAVKYSGASRIEVAFKLEPDCHYSFGVSDNGVGMKEKPQQGSGNGMLNMKKRAEAIHARLEVESGKNAGTTIRLYGKII